MKKLKKKSSPGDFIKEELERRGWTRGDLAFLMGRNGYDVTYLISGKKRITPEIAQELATAFRDTPEVWLQRESEYRLSQLEDVDDAKDKLSQIYNVFPAKEMIKRGWIEPSNDVTELEQSFLRFFDIASIDEKPVASHAAFKSGSYSETSIEQVAWLKRAIQLAPSVMVNQFSDISLSTAFEKLSRFLSDVEDIRRVPRVLADAGIRLLVVEALPGSKIDGATFWLDSQSPVIVLSLRFDRIDNFWHVLLHELFHIKKREGQDGPIIEYDLLSEDSTDTERPEIEQRANRDAAEFAIPSKKLESFILRVHPLYTEQKINGFGALNKVHSGLLVGQLHHRFRITGRGLPFSHYRKFLVKIRNIVTDAAFTDGWGTKHLT